MQCNATEHLYSASYQRSSHEDGPKGNFQVFNWERVQWGQLFQALYRCTYTRYGSIRENCTEFSQFMVHYRPTAYIYRYLRECIMKTRRTFCGQNLSYLLLRFLSNQRNEDYAVNDESILDIEDDRNSRTYRQNTRENRPNGVL